MAEDFAGTAPDAGAADPGTSTDPAGTAPPDVPSATAGPESGLDTLIDPATLPDELKPHWSRMTAAYNKRLSTLREQQKEVDGLRQKAAVVDRFYSDQDYARQVIQQMAPQLGLPLSTSPPASPPASRGTGAVPPNVLQAVQDAFADNPALAFMADDLAKAAWAAAQQVIKPFEEEKHQQSQQQRQSEYQALVAALADKAPDWESYEPEMQKIALFLHNALTGKGPLQHPQYGSVLEWLFSKASGTQYATGEAARRMQKAVTNKTTTGSAAPPPPPNVQELIKQAPNFREKIAIAFQDGLAAATNARSRTG